MKPIRVCYFGAFDPSYARNNFLRRSLEIAGSRVVTCNAPAHWPTQRKLAPLVQQYRRVWRECDVIVVAEFGQTLVPLARLLGNATRRPVAFDHVIGLYEMTVVERRRYPPGHIQARKLFWLDKLAGALAQLVLTGTGAYKRYLHETFNIPLRRIHVAALGVNDEIFYPIETSSMTADECVVLYLGSYIPNHGVEVILQAAQQFADDANVRFRFIGDGEGKRAAMAYARRAELSNVEFLPRVSFESLPKQIAQAAVVLGNFGDTAQSRKAMANKVLQGLAMKKAVVTGDTEAIRENFEHGIHLLMTPLGAPEPLAKALRQLSDDRDLRRRLGQAGYERVRSRLTLQPVGGELQSALAALAARN